MTAVAAKIKRWGAELGFAKLGICDIDLQEHGHKLQEWLDNNFHGDMKFMERNQDLRLHPNKLHAGTIKVISVSMNYLPPEAGLAKTLDNPLKANISRYATGRDYHKLMRKLLKQLALKIETELPELNYRPFVDSAPVLERSLAVKAGIGWVGKNSLILNEVDGSWFFLGELFVNIDLPVDQPVADQCGTCVACKTICPTNAIVADAVIDAKRCISYLTIELKGAIPHEFRRAMGNRIYGCDDCQIVCPFNQQAPLTKNKDFWQRPTLKNKDLLELFAWSEEEFLLHTQGSAIRRIGYESWQRNISVALGNAPASLEIVDALEKARLHIDPDCFLSEHFAWALAEQQNKLTTLLGADVLSRKTQRLVRIINKGLPRDA